jgi:hypothetical protein
MEISNLDTVGTITTMPKSTITTAQYSTSVSFGKLSSEALAGIVKDSIENSLREEDKDGTLSKLITSIVLDKMYELSGMSEEELVETELYKRISDKVSQRLDNIENRLSILENTIALTNINLDRLRESQSNYYNYPPTSTDYRYYGGTE